MDTIHKIEKTLLIFGLCMILACCTPAETIVQTAIAQTQAAAPTNTATGLSNQALVETAVAQTLTPAAAAAAMAVSIASGEQIQTAVVQTLTALVPTQTVTPLISPTPVTPTPTITNTHLPWPTITNTVEPFIPSGPITLTNIVDNGGNQVSLTWQADGSFVNGFCIVWSGIHSEPSYPDDYWARFNGHARSAVVEVLQSGSHYFRIGEMDAGGDRCINYSNIVPFTNQ